MNAHKKSATILLWSFTIVLTLLSVFYQRLTGPTHEKRGKIKIAGQTIKYQLLRSFETTTDAVMKFSVNDTNVTGILKWKRKKVMMSGALIH